MLFYPLYYNIISLASLKITQEFHLLLNGLAENKIIFCDFKSQNNVWITKGSDNGDSDNQGSTVLCYHTITAVKATFYKDTIYGYWNI